MLAKNKPERYESAEFETGGYNGKMVLYPNGNKSKNVNGSISVNIMLVETCFPRRLWPEVNQNNDKYYIYSPNGETRFHRMKLEWGFDQFMPLMMFNDPSSGYLVDDTCIFGAEVFVCNKNSSKGEQLVMMKNVNSYKHTWKTYSFLSIEPTIYFLMNRSMPFNSGDYEWKILFYPRGNGSHISIYLALADPASLPYGTRIYAEFTICIIDHVHGSKNHIQKVNYWFTASKPVFGWPNFIAFTDFKMPSKGFLVNDIFIYSRSRSYCPWCHYWTLKVIGAPRY